MTAWQLQDAKNRFSALVKAAESEGPQVVTVHGKDKAVLLSVEAYQQLIQRKVVCWTFSEFSVGQNRY